MVGFVANDGAVRPLNEGFLPDRLEQRAVYDWGLLARQDLILVFDLANVEVIAKQVVQCAAAKWYAAARRSRRELLDSGSDVSFPEVSNQFVDAAEFEISPVDRSDQLSFSFDDGNLAVFHLIPTGQVASDPEALTFGCRNLVPDTLGGDLPLKLGKGQKHVEC